MGISEAKKKIVIDNYFKSECDVNTSIKEAFTKGFELGLKKAPTTLQPKIGHWIDDRCSECGKGIEDLIDSREWYRNEQPNFCSFCGVRYCHPQAESEDKDDD